MPFGLFENYGIRRMNKVSSERADWPRGGQNMAQEGNKKLRAYTAIGLTLCVVIGNAQAVHASTSTSTNTNTNTNTKIINAINGLIAETASKAVPKGAPGGISDYVKTVVGGAVSGFEIGGVTGTKSAASKEISNIAKNPSAGQLATANSQIGLAVAGGQMGGRLSGLISGMESKVISGSKELAKSLLKDAIHLIPGK